VSALPQPDERVTCLSCRFSYPGVRGFCPMCGAPAPAPDEIVPGPRRVGPKTAAGSQVSSRSILWTSLRKMGRKPLFVAFGFLLSASALFFLRSRNTPPNIIAPAPANAAASPEVAPPAPAAPAAAAVQPESLKKEPAVVSTRPNTAPASAMDDPAELWKQVRRGNADAEVTLAKFYLEGNKVPQNCEQAHLLLVAAAKKQSRAAGLLLTGLYPLRCP